MDCAHLQFDSPDCVLCPRSICPVVVAARPVPTAEDLEAAPSMPRRVLDSAVVVYRSVGCGLWGVALRCAGMPLEKIAFFANSGQVSGASQLSQAARLTFAQGALAPYRVIGSASIVAWFLQYSCMSFVFQLADSAFSLGLSVDRVAYGVAVSGPAAAQGSQGTGRAGPPGEASPAAVAAAGIGWGSMLKFAKDVAAASVAGAVESAVSNRAEAQRYHGLDRFRSLEARTPPSRLGRWLGPAFAASVSRNSVMTYSAFVATPALYQQHVPDHSKSSSSLFLFGLGVNMFAGNLVAVTQQTLWGRALDAWAAGGGRPVPYVTVVRAALRAEGLAAFITPGKWVSRVLMNAPAEGTLSWFYNRLLPIGEPSFVRVVHAAYNQLAPKPAPLPLHHHRVGGGSRHATVESTSP